MLFQRILWRWSLTALEDALSRMTEPLLSLCPMQIDFASRFSDFGTSAEDDRERDVVADCTMEGPCVVWPTQASSTEVDVSRRDGCGFRPTNDRGSMQAGFQVCPGPLELK